MDRERNGVSDQQIALNQPGRGHAYSGFRNGLQRLRNRWIDQDFARKRGVLEPLCAIYEPSARAVLERHAARGHFCPRHIMIEEKADLIALPKGATDALTNLNTPQDLERYSPDTPGYTHTYRSEEFGVQFAVGVKGTF